MNNFFQFLIRVLAIGGLSLIFISAIVFLKPAKLHKRRKSSTSLLKYTYLLYLASFLAFLYFLMFTGKDLKEYFHERNYFLLIFGGIIPTGAMLLRRKMHNGRSLYNYFFSILNVSIVVLLAPLSEKKMISVLSYWQIFFR